MSFKNGKYFNAITIQSVYNSVSLVNQLSNIRIAYFWHTPSAFRVVSQNSLSIIN